MTPLEAYDYLKNRVEWRSPLNTGFKFLPFNESQSGRFLQEEHISVSIPIIYETITDSDITDTQFQDELEVFKKRAILQMLHDVFYDKEEIIEDWILDKVGIYDYAIILRVTNNVLYDILNSTRLNETTLVNEENIKRWFVDLNGLTDKENGVFVKGFVSRYKREIDRIRQALFNATNEHLNVVTLR